MHGVSLIYPNGVHALHDINLYVEKAEFAFLVGATGSGKSSLLRLINRDALPSSGSIFVDNHDITDLKRSQVPLLRRKIGMVFQDFKLLPQKTVYENVAYALEVTGTSRKEIVRRVAKVLEIVNLTDRQRTFPAELSGGEQQRTSLARALVNSPLILMADEPTGNLDPDSSWEIMQLLLRVNARGTTVLVATHNKSIVDAMKKRVIVLSQGRIAYDRERSPYLPVVETPQIKKEA